MAGGSGVEAGVFRQLAGSRCEGMPGLQHVAEQRRRHPHFRFEEGQLAPRHQPRQGLKNFAFSKID